MDTLKAISLLQDLGYSDQQIKQIIDGSALFTSTTPAATTTAPVESAVAATTQQPEIKVASAADEAPDDAGHITLQMLSLQKETNRLLAQLTAATQNNNILNNSVSTQQADISSLLHGYKEG